MSDVISIEGLAVEATIGVYEWEKNTRQTLIMNMELTCDFSCSAISDDIADAVDYGAVSRSVATLIGNTRFQLLEALAEEVAMLVLRQFDVSAIRLRVSKPGAIPKAQNVSVEIYRTR